MKNQYPRRYKTSWYDPLARGFAAEPKERRNTGNLSEDVAVRYLLKHGYSIIARNVTFRGGELDIVAEDATHLVFVEVRSTYSRSAHRPEHGIGWEKQRHLLHAADLFLPRYRGDRVNYRFDVISVESSSGEVLQHFRGAFDASPR